MNFGVTFGFANLKPGQIPSARLFKSQIDLAVLAEELGFDHIWTAGHPATDMYCPAQFPPLAAIAARTNRIRLGTYIVALPLYHPLQVTEEAVTLDVLSDGRFDLGVGAGNFLHEFEAYGVSRRERAGRMEEALTIIRGLWTEESFSFEGKYWRIPPFSLNLRPVQANPPLWCAATAEAAFDRAARHGCHLAGTATGFDYYESRLREHGHDPADFFKGMLQVVHLAEKTDEAWERAAPSILARVHRYKREFDAHDDFEVFRRQPGGYFGVDPLPDSVDDIDKIRRLHFLGAPFVVGSPEDVRRAVESAQDKGVTHLIMNMAPPRLDPRLTEHSMRLFAREVMPAFRKPRTDSALRHEADRGTPDAAVPLRR